MSGRVGLVAVVVFALLAPPALAADRTPPTKPGNLRVTATTQTTVSLAWNASTDNSGSVSYKVQIWRDGGYATLATLPRTQTSYTATGLIPNVQYFLHVEAVDPSGNRRLSDLVYPTTLPDRTPPPAPTNLRVTNVTASEVALAWDAPPDDTGIRKYYIGVTGATSWNLIWTGPTSVRVVGLAPTSAHSFTVKAEDHGYNVSPATAPVSATTIASTDVTPPSAPANLRVSNADGCLEINVRWTGSTDDQDPPEAIRYLLFVNGVLDPVSTVIGATRNNTYGPDGLNTFELRAVDSAGNVSAPSNQDTEQLTDCFG
jgi:chitodextrinase